MFEISAFYKKNVKDYNQLIITNICEASHKHRACRDAICS